MPSYRVVTLSSGKPLQAGACQGQSLCLEDLSGSNGENGWEQSGLKPTAVVQHRIMKLLNWRAAARWERRFRAEEFQRKSWGS